MKTLFISSIIILAAFTISANNPSPDDYVITKDDVLHYTKLSFGATKARLILDNDNKITLMNNELIAYKKNGKVFEKVPLYYKDKKTKHQVFMEIVKYTNGMKLYRYKTYNEEVNLPYSTSGPQLVEQYYVYKNGDYHLQIDESNYKTVFAFFGIDAKLAK